MAEGAKVVEQAVEVFVNDRGAVAGNLELHAFQQVGMPAVRTEVVLKEASDAFEDVLAAVVEVVQVVAHGGAVVKRNLFGWFAQQLFAGAKGLEQPAYPGQLVTDIGNEEGEVMLHRSCFIDHAS
jgi:hypothetical protein